MRGRRPRGGDWEVLFTPKMAPAEKPTAPPETIATTLDTRGLEPPQPMVRVLAALEGMAPGSTLEVYTEREPGFLYQELRACGIPVRSEALGRAGYRHVISVAGPAGVAAS
jgi:Uncharacterized conserved protein (DUF2249)